MDSREFLGLEPTHNPFRWKLPVTPGISAGGNFLFGGCGLGAAISAMEGTSGRPCVWATAQYLSYAKPGEVVDIDVTIAVDGHQITQARAVCHVADREILTVNAALGDRPIEESGQWEQMPTDVPPPEECSERPHFGEMAGTISERLDERMIKARVVRQARRQHARRRPDDAVGATSRRDHRCRRHHAGNPRRLRADGRRPGARRPGRREQPRQHTARCAARCRRSGCSWTSGSTPSSAGSATGSCTCSPRTARYVAGYGESVGDRPLLANARPTTRSRTARPRQRSSRASAVRPATPDSIRRTVAEGRRERDAEVGVDAHVPGRRSREAASSGARPRRPEWRMEIAVIAGR